MDNLDRVLAQAGMGRGIDTSSLIGGFGQTGTTGGIGPGPLTEVSLPTQTPVPTAEPRGGGFWAQLGEGFTQPFTIIPRKTGLMEDQYKEPISFGDRAGRFVGQLAGWGLLGAITAATLGKGTVAVLGGATMATKGGLTAKAIKYGVSGAATSALAGVDEDLPPGELAKRAGYGAAAGVFFTMLGPMTKGIRADIMSRYYMTRMGIEGRHLAPGVAPNILKNKGALASHVRGMTKPQAQAILDEMDLTKLPPGVKSNLKNTISTPQWKQVENMSPRQAASMFHQRVPIKQRSQLPQDQLGLIMDSLFGEPTYRKMLKPIMRPAIKSVYKSRKMQLRADNGLPLDHSSAYELALLGRAPGNPRLTENLPDGLVGKEINKRHLQGQLKSLQGMISNRLKKKQQLMEETSGHPAYLPGAGRNYLDYTKQESRLKYLQGQLTKFQKAGKSSEVIRVRKEIQDVRGEMSRILNNVGVDADTMKQNHLRYTQWRDLTREIDQLETARYSLSPRVEKTLRLADRGIYQKALDETPAEEARAIHQAWGVEAKVPKPPLLDILRKYKVISPDQLPAKGKSEYYTKRFMMKQAGEAVEESHGFFFNNEKFMPKDTIGVLRKKYQLMPDVKVPTALDEALRYKPPSFWERYFAPKRGPFGEGTQRVFRNALSSKRQFEDMWEGRVTKLTHGLKPEERRAIYKYLVSQDKQQARSALIREGTEVQGAPKWTPALEKKAEGVEKLFRELAEKFGMDPSRLIQNYLPRIAGEGWATTRRTVAGIPVKHKPFFEEMRTGYLVGAEQDVDSLLRAYIRSGSKKLFLDPAFRVTDKRWAPKEFVKRVKVEMDDLLREHTPVGQRTKITPDKLPARAKMQYDRLAKEMQNVEDDMARKIQGAVKRGIPHAQAEETFGMDPSKLDMYTNFKRSTLGMPEDLQNLVNTTLNSAGKLLYGKDPGGNFTRDISSWLMWLQYNSTLSWNLFSPIKNLTQQILSVATLDDNPLVGIKYWGKAYRYLMTEQGRHFAALTNANLTNRISHQALSYQYSAASKYPWLQKFADAGFAGFKKSDRMNVTVSHMMKLMYERDRGASIADAVESAYTFTMGTQFMYGVDSPMIYENSFGRLLGTLLSWPLNFTHLMREHASQGAYQKAATALGGYVLASEALSASGLSFQSIHPAQTAEGLIPVAMLEGSDSSPLIISALNALFEYPRALGSGDPAARDWAFQDFKRSMSTFIPFMTQIRRIDEAIDLVYNDFVKYENDYKRQALFGADRGRLMYEASPGEAVASLIGTPSAKVQRFRDMKMISEEQSNYRHLRASAMEDLFEGDLEGFLKKQDKLIVLYGKGIEPHEVERELETYREMNAFERRAIGLPATFRDPFLGELGRDQERPPVFEPVDFPQVGF